MFIAVFHFFVSVIVFILMFCLGFVSFGLLWPNEVNKMLFYGPIDRKTKRNNGKAKALPAVEKASHAVEKSKIDMLEQQLVYLKQQNAEMKDQMSEVILLLKKR